VEYTKASDFPNRFTNALRRSL